MSAKKRITRTTNSQSATNKPPPAPRQQTNTNAAHDSTSDETQQTFQTTATTSIHVDKDHTLENTEVVISNLPHSTNKRPHAHARRKPATAPPPLRHTNDASHDDNHNENVQTVLATESPDSNINEEMSENSS